jgi:hypothetical protein
MTLSLQQQTSLVQAWQVCGMVGRLLLGSLQLGLLVT